MGQFKLRSIRVFISLLIFLAIVPMLGIVAYSGLERRQQSIEFARHDVQRLTQSMAIVLVGLRQSVQQVLSTLALVPAVQKLDIPSCSTLFKSITDQLPEYLGLTLISTDGEVLASNRPFTRISLKDRKHFLDAMRTGKFSTGEYIITRVGNETPSFAFASPVINSGGEITGVLGAVLRLDQLGDLFELGTMSEKSFIAITDHQGIRLFYYPAMSTNPVGQAIKNSNWQLAQKGPNSGTMEVEGSDGMTRIISYEKVFNADGKLFFVAWAGIPQKMILAGPNSVLIRNVLLTAFICALALAMAWHIGRRKIISPITALVETTEHFSGGKLDTRNAVRTDVRELSMLATAFNEMMSSLQNNYETLKKRENNLAEAQRIAHTGSWQLVKDTDIFSGSAEIARILEMPDVEKGIPLSELEKILHSADRAALRSAISRAFETGEPYKLTLKCNTRNDGSKWLLVRGEAKQAESGDQTVLHGTATDITERTLMEKERDNLQDQLIQSQKIEAVGRLAGGVAHDFNNMLSIIIGNIEIAMDHIDRDSPLYDGLTDCLDAAERPSNLVRQLLAFARRQTASPKPLDLNIVIGNMLKMMQRLIGEGIELLWDPGERPAMVKIDPAQIDQVLANLCINARDAINGIGTISIATSIVELDPIKEDATTNNRTGTFVLITISDTGNGMDIETQKNIFDPFFTTKELGKGTGLGLATVYGIIKQNKGYIDVSSQPGRGTTFSIYLPKFEGEVIGVEAPLQEMSSHSDEMSSDRDSGDVSPKTILQA